MYNEKLHLSAELAALISELLTEPFARENGFVEMNLDQIGKFLEDGREALHHTEPSAELEAAKASHEKCVNVYCTILMELEASDMSLPEDPLFDLTQRNEGTQILTDLMPRVADVPSMTPSSTSPTGSAPLFPDLKEEEILIAPEAVNAGTFEDHTTAEGTITPIAEEEAIQQAIEEEKVYDEAMTTRGSPHEAEFRGVMQTFKHPESRDHLELALYFQLVKGGSFPFAAAHADRLSGQSFSFALESEAFARIAPTVKEMWSSRETAIRGLLDFGNRRFELHPSLKKHLDGLAKAHSVWLPEGKYPYAQTLSSLRYIMATLTVENFQPSLLEVGILVFFFGQNKALEGVSLKNVIGAEGLSANEIIELNFRLARAHKFRAKIFHAAAVVADGEMDQLQEDLIRIFGLFARLSLGGAGLKKAA